MSQDQVTATSFAPLAPMVPELHEWKYGMRRLMQEIIPGVFLGPHSAAMRSHLNVLLSQGVTHIVCVRQDIEAHIVRPHFLDKFKYLTLDIADSASENIIPHFSKVRQFVDECLILGGKVLIHGSNGVSRSATLVLAYVMQKYGLTCLEAYTLVRNRRFCIQPNKGFFAQLVEFEPIYRAQQTLQHGQSSNLNNSKKRKVDHLEQETESESELFTPFPPPPSPVSTCEVDNIMDVSLT